VPAGFKDNPKMDFLAGVFVLAVHDSVTCRALHGQIIEVEAVALSRCVGLALVLLNGLFGGLAGVD
jgi:hypothetical protein